MILPSNRFLFLEVRNLANRLINKVWEIGCLVVLVRYNEVIISALMRTAQVVPGCPGDVS